MNKWILYTVTLCFAVYWASNLLLWFPWSYSTVLGITLMLTLSPLLWAYTTYLALITFPQPGLYKAAILVALIFLPIAIILDYVFFGIIRNAMEELYHPTTLYGYAFLLVLPFLVVLIFRKNLLSFRRSVSKSNIVKALASGIACITILTLIIVLGIEI